MKYTLNLLNDHLCVEVHGKNWVLDTGSPISFGNSDLRFGGLSISVEKIGMGGLMGATLTADSLSDDIDITVEGLIGNDVLGRFAVIFDLPNSTLEVLPNDADIFGSTAVAFDMLMGIPVFDCALNGKASRMFFDTGAMISYWQDALLNQGPSLGTFEDFYPGFGNFAVETYAVDAAIDSLQMPIRTGSLPGALGMALTMVVNGILGNEVLREHRLAYCASKKLYEWQ